MKCQYSFYFSYVRINKCSNGVVVVSTQILYQAEVVRFLVSSCYHVNLHSIDYCIGIKSYKKMEEILVLLFSVCEVVLFSFDLAEPAYPGILIIVMVVVISTFDEWWGIIRSEIKKVVECRYKVRKGYIIIYYLLPIFFEVRRNSVS